jgi:hypothetical protein
MLLEELIKINIDLGYKVDSIVIYKGQEQMAAEIASQFCQKHGFDHRAHAALTEEIQKNINSVLQPAVLTSIEELDGPQNSRYFSNHV